MFGINLFYIIARHNLNCYMYSFRKSNYSESTATVVNNGEGSDESQPTKSVVKALYSEVNKHSHNQPNSDAYAEVVPNANQQTKKSGSSPEIVYSTPQFAEDPKSTPLYTNYEVANRVKDPGMVPTLRGQTHSIFPMSYSNDHVDDDDDDNDHDS